MTMHRAGRGTTMQLTRYTDYSLRVLLYLGTQPERLATVNEIAENYGISRNHLVKVVNHLGNLGYVRTIRGKGGGIRLARRPETINIGELVRLTEHDLALLECFNLESNTCPIAPICALKGIVAEARNAFMAVLDAHTLDEVLDDRQSLIDVLGIPVRIDGP